MNTKKYPISRRNFIKVSAATLPPFQLCLLAAVMLKKYRPQ
jgi:hypothetical protein